ncbi:uncharacterized protein [Watersipora subatra]|uniref:uncharacterized protein isoform X1 n=1 Tax=Watersipora subatra TaxID=2589382 RepID=UPI00355ADF07
MGKVMVQRSMPMIKRCCFSRNLRTGSIACGIWTLVWCFYSLATSVWGLTYTSGKSEPDSLSTGELIPPEPLTNGNTGLATLVWITLCVSLPTFFSSILVIVAVFKHNARLMIPWMIMVAILLVLDASTIIADVVMVGFESHVIAALLIWIIISLINIYCELCVISHYQEVAAGRGTVQHYFGILPTALQERTLIHHEDEEEDEASQDLDGNYFSFEAVVPINSHHGSTDLVAPMNSHHGSTDMVVPMNSHRGSTDMVAPMNSHHGSTDMVAPMNSHHGSKDMVAPMNSHHGSTDMVAPMNSHHGSKDMVVPINSHHGSTDMVAPVNSHHGSTDMVAPMNSHHGSTDMVAPMNSHHGSTDMVAPISISTSEGNH